MRTIAKLFGQSPFVPLQSHMEKVAQCVKQTPDLLEAYFKGDASTVEQISKKISKQEHDADLVKQDIRNSLPRGLFMPVDRANFLRILSVQDDLADKAENIGVILGFKQAAAPDSFKKSLSAFMEKNLEAFDGVRDVVGQLDELLETGFGGVEAEKVQDMVGKVALLEHEADLLQREVLRELLKHELEMTHGDFWLWTRVIQQLSQISDLSENLANLIRATLEFK